MTAITGEVRSYIICIFSFIRKFVTLVNMKLYKYLTSIGEQYQIRKSKKHQHVNQVINTIENAVIVDIHITLNKRIKPQ